MAFVRRKTKSPYWQAVFTDETGQRAERSTKETDVRKARRVAEEWEWAAKRARKGELTQTAILKTFGELLERSTGESLEIQYPAKSFFAEWLLDKGAGGKSTSTVSRYRPILNGFLTYLGEKRSSLSMSGITATDITRFRNQQLEEGKSASTADFSVKVLRAVLETARRRSIILSNPAQAVESLGAIQEERLPFTDEQVKTLLHHADEEWTGMILFGFYTGIRLKDAASLTWDCIDLNSHTLSFQEAKTSRRKKDRRDTVVYLHPGIIAWLQKQPKGIGKAPLFRSLHNKHAGSAGGLSNTFRGLMEKAGVISPMGEKKTGKGRRLRKLSFHSLRHTFISRLANADVSSDVRKAMSGHSSDEIHSRYVHLDLSAQKAAVARLPNLQLALPEIVG